MSREKAAELGCRVMAEIGAQASHGIELKYVLMAPIYAIPKVLKKQGISMGDVDLFEINEAFGVVNAICINEAGIPWEKTNLHGGGISLGHPTGYTGARLTLHLANYLKPGELGLASACGGGGLTGSLIVQGE